MRNQTSAGCAGTTQARATPSSSPAALSDLIPWTLARARALSAIALLFPRPAAPDLPERQAA